LLVDDHQIVREGIRASLAHYRFVQVVGEAGSGREALENMAALNPDVVLMDINMPEMSGLDATRRAAKEYPLVKVLVVTVHDTRQYVLEILRAGAQGYVLKDASPDELARAIVAVFRGDAFFSPSVSRLLLQSLIQSSESAQANTAPALARRERQVLNLVINGKTNKEIALDLGVAVRTIETFRQRLMRKLGVRNAAELTRYAFANHLLEE
jgi:two-component system, NarL family, nitrate/nitrite response regulator NarL